MWGCAHLSTRPVDTLHRLCCIFGQVAGGGGGDNVKIERDHQGHGVGQMLALRCIEHASAAACRFQKFASGGLVSIRRVYPDENSLVPSLLQQVRED